MGLPAKLPTPKSQPPRRRRTHWALGIGRWGVATLVIPCAALTACGKKGSPQTPFVYVPAEVSGVTPRRVGTDVYVTLTVPAQNVDTSKPAAISRVEVFGVTSLTPLLRTRFLEIAELIATIPVAPVPPPGQAPPPGPPHGAVQGTPVTIRDTLMADDLFPRELPPLPGARPTPGVAAPPVNRVLRRFYMVVPFNLVGLPGPPSAIVEVLLPPLPEPPPVVRVSTTPLTAIVEWEPPGGLIGWLLDQAPPVERPPSDDLIRLAAPAAPTAALAAGPTTYLVYMERAPDPLVLPDRRTLPQPWTMKPPAAVSPAVTALRFAQPIELDERELCFTVRSVRGGIEGPPSPSACIRPIDAYPPAPPTALTAAAAEGQISLVWDPSSEADLGGYLVLRREAGSATLLPLTATPIVGARYVDRQVKAGVQYVYAVIAVDTRLPLPNMSLPSAEASDTAR